MTADQTQRDILMSVIKL